MQGVGFRAFVQGTANKFGISGWARNLDDGDVEVYAIGTSSTLSELESALWSGPRLSDVRGVTSREDTVDAGVSGFRIR